MGLGCSSLIGARQTRAPHEHEQYWNQYGDYMRDEQIIDQMIPNPNQDGKDTGNTSERELGSWQALRQYSTKRAARDNKTRTAQHRRAIDAIEGVKPASRPRFVSQGRKGLAFGQAGFDRAQRLVGLMGYIANIPAHVSDGRETIAHYHELWHVERSFRMRKNDLKARPIFHHAKDAIHTQPHRRHRSPRNRQAPTSYNRNYHAQTGRQAH